MRAHRYTVAISSVSVVSNAPLGTENRFEGTQASLDGPENISSTEKMTFIGLFSGYVTVVRANRQYCRNK